jgi:hypothetical protein
MNFINKGLKYNLNRKPKNWIKTFTLETEIAVNYLPIHDQDHFRWQIAKNINRIYLQHSRGWYGYDEKQFKTLKQIRNKLIQSHVAIVRTEKAQSIITIYCTNYVEKTDDFITCNHFTKLNSDPTNQFQKQIRSYLNNKFLTFNKNIKS